MRFLLILLLAFSCAFAAVVQVTNYTAYATPQAVFYDGNGYLNTLFFSNGSGADMLYVVTTSNNAIIANYSAAFNHSLYEQTLGIFWWNGYTAVEFRQATGNITYLLLPNSTFASAPYSLATVGYGQANVSDINYDPNTRLMLANLTAPASGGFYPYSAAGGLNDWILGAYWQNHTIQRFINWSVASSYTAQYGATPANAAFTNWYAWAANNTNQLVLINLSSTDVNRIMGRTVAPERTSAGFSRHGNAIYAWLFGTGTTNDTIYRVDTGKSFNFTSTFTRTTPFIYATDSAFVFFANNGTDVAVTCSFNSTASCQIIPEADYKIANPEGPYFASKSNSTSVTFGIGNLSGSNLTYTETAYDAALACFDEQVTTNVKNFTVSILSDTASLSPTQTMWAYATPSSLMGTGIKKIYMTCSNGTPREYLLGLDSDYLLTAYSLNLTLGSYYLFTVKNTLGVVLPDTIVSAYRYDPIQSAYIVVEQGITDSTGSVTFYLQPLTNYVLISEKSGYITLSTTFVPSTLAQIAITINQEAGFVQPMPNYNFPFGDVSFQITPTTVSSTNTTNITFIVSSASSSLEYWGMTIVKTNSTNTTTVYTSNQTGASGGILNYTATENGTYVISVWIKHEDFSLYYPFPKTFTISPQTGFILARERFNLTHPIGGWAFYFLGVICAMIAAGWVSRYTYEGASWVGLIILWGFSLFYPGAIFTTTIGDVAIEITSVMATMLTTMGVLSVTYLMKQGV